MFNPYVLLGLLVFWVASVAGAYWKGHTAAQDAARAAYATELEHTIAAHNEDALADMEAAREAGVRDAAAKTKVVTITNEVERIIHEKPAPVICRVTDDTFRLLQLAVSVANGTDPSASESVPKSSPGVGSATKP